MRKALAMINPDVRPFIGEAKEFYLEEYSKAPLGVHRAKSLKYFDALDKYMGGSEIHDLCDEFNMSVSNMVTQLKSANQRLLLYLNVRGKH